MSARLRRAVRFFRLALVCLTLVWSSAPAAAAPLVDAIVMVAAERAPAPERLSPRPSAQRFVHVEHAPAPAPAWRVSPPAPPTLRITAARSQSPPRRLYLVHRALLC